MFDKLLSALPSNPSLIHKLSFYSKRIRKEQAVRRIGLTFVVLTFVIQFFAFISPPVATSAESTNDMIAGGFVGNPSLATQSCNNNVHDYKTVLAAFGITCTMVANAQTVSLDSNAFSGRLYSMGWDPYKFADEGSITIGSDTLYYRHLTDWDTDGVSRYDALLISVNGQPFYILYLCGNLVTVGIPQTITPPPPPPPKTCQPLVGSNDSNDCVASKTAVNVTAGGTDANNTTAQAGDLIKYTLYLDNTGPTEVKDYIFKDNLAYVLDYSQLKDLGGGTYDSSTQNIVFPGVNIAPDQTVSKTFEVQIDNPIPDTPPPASDPNYYNMKMTNFYGTSIITINLPTTPITTVETASTTLPNTGPGSGVIIAAAVVAIAGFFYYRSRLIAKESVIAIKSNIGAL